MALRRVWNSVRSSWYLTNLLHRFPTVSEFDQRAQEYELDYLKIVAARAGERWPRNTPACRSRTLHEPDFHQDPGWLDWYAGPSKPRFKLPPAVSMRIAMCSARATNFPMRPSASTRRATPARQQLFALRDHLGFARNVIVQATCHGADNRAMVDALPALERQGARRGHGEAQRQRRANCSDCTPPACAACASTSSSAWSTSRRRTNCWRSPAASRSSAGTWSSISRRMDLPELWDFFTALPTTVVVDHMGRPDVSKPVDGPEFALFLKFMREHANVWSKVSCPERLSVTGPKALNGERNAYRDVVPFARRVVEAFPGPRAVGHRLAAPEPEGPHARRRPAGRLHPAHRDARRSCSASCWSTTRCGCTGR